VYKVKKKKEKKEKKSLCIFAEKGRHWDLGHISKPDLNTVGSM